MSQIEVLKVSDFKTDEKPIKKIGAKPMNAIIVLAAVGVIFLVIPHAWVFGVILLPIAALAYFSFKNYTQIALYKDYFIFYNAPSEEDHTCEKIKWDDIREWKLDHNGEGPTSFVVVMKDGSILTKSVLNWQSIWKVFHKRVEKSEQIERHKKFLNDSNGIHWGKK